MELAAIVSVVVIVGVLATALLGVLIDRSVD
jgi:hypothetical protein